MKIPNHEKSQIPKGKVADYLLNPDHPDGSSKARFLIKMGFDNDTLSVALLEHVQKNNVIEIKTTLYGIKYVVEGLLISPSG